MQLECQSCGHALHGRDVDFHALRASCRHCGWQLGGDSSVYRKPTHATPSTDDEEPVSRPVPMPFLPHNIGVTEEGSGRRKALEIVIVPDERRQFYLVLPVAIGGMLMMLLVLPPLYVGLLLAVWLSLFYVAAVYRFNARHLYVSHDAITVSFSPLPWFTRRVAVEDLEQLWVDEHRDQHRRLRYRLRARLKRKDIVLVDHLAEPSGALHLERRIEKMLGIADRPVEGETLAGTRQR